ncbi:hypothetical protein D3C81_2175300 [compost metagenome]
MDTKQIKRVCKVIRGHKSKGGLDYKDRGCLNLILMLRVADELCKSGKVPSDAIKTITKYRALAHSTSILHRDINKFFEILK